MKLEKVSYNSYGSASNLLVSQKFQPQQKYGNQPSFNGGINQSELVKDMQKLMPASIKGMTKFADNMGEISNIFINAAGTGLVAPLFIKYNPISKTDEDTRTYTAWRQPISAVLAIGTQASMVAPFNKLISNMANSGYLPDFYNKTNFQDDSYIKKMIKRTEKNITPEELKKSVKKELDKQYAEFLENLKTKNTILIKKYKAPTKTMDKSLYDNIIIDTIDDMINQDKAALQICDTTSEKRGIRSEFLRLQNEKAGKVLKEIDTKFGELNSLPEYKSFLNEKIKSLKSQNADKELIAMIQEVLDRATPKVNGQEANALMGEMKNKVGKMLSHVDTYSNILSEKEVVNHVEQSVINKKTSLKSSIEILEKIKENVKEGKETVSSIEKTIEQKLKISNIIEECSIKSKFSEKVYSRLKHNVNESLRGFKQWTGLLISLAVIPITCSLLNWIYPIFMDAVFPNLSNKKHDNEASTLVAKAPKKEED